MINGIDSHYKQSCSYKFYKNKKQKETERLKSF